MTLWGAGSFFWQWQLGLLVLQGVWRMVKGSVMGLLGPEENQGAEEVPLTHAGSWSR